MRILFVIENGLQESLGVASLGAAVKAAGHEADVVLYSHVPDLGAYIAQTRPDVIGLSLITGAHQFGYHLARWVKQCFGIPVIAGGPHATFYPEHMLQSGTFDYVCRGEGEIPLVAFMNGLASRSPLNAIPGIWVCHDGKVIKNDPDVVVADLDSLPVPERSLFYKYPFLRDMSLKRFVSGVGCPYPCTFCHSPLMRDEMKGKGRFVRQKSPSYLINEIQSVRKIARLDNIHFSDDTFGLDARWLESFTELYRKEIGLPFTCNARADTPVRMVELLTKAGCTGVQIGLESGSPRIRRELLKKQWSNEQAVETCRLFKQAGISILATNMVALPSETLDEAWATVELNVRCCVDFARCNVFLAHPALELTRWAMAHGYIRPDYTLDHFSADALNPIVTTPHREAFINLANLFSLAVQHRSARNMIRRRLLAMKPNRLFDTVGAFNLLHDFRFFSLRLLPAGRYFWNTLRSPFGFRYGAWPTNRVGHLVSMDAKTDSSIDSLI